MAGQFWLGASPETIIRSWFGLQSSEGLTLAGGSISKVVHDSELLTVKLLNG